MTILDLPRPESGQTRDLDDLIAAALPYLSTAWGNESAEDLIRRGVPREKVLALVAEQTLAA